MVAHSLAPLPVHADAELSAGWDLGWRGTVTVVVLLPGRVVDPLVDDPVLTVLATVGGGFGFVVGGVVESGVELWGGFGPPHGFAAHGTNVLESATVLPGGFLGQYVLDDPVLAVLASLGQTYQAVDDNVLVSAVSLLGDLELPDTRRSPALTHFDGANFLQRPVSDAALSGGTTFSVAVLFDPELVEVGVDGVVVSKHNPTDTQSGWQVAWDATTGQCTVTVSSALDGSNRAERTTAVAGDGIRTRSLLVFTYDATGAADLQLYVNQASSQGSQTDTGTPGGMTNNTEPFAIACAEPSNGGADFFTGAVYLVAAWNVALSPADAVKIDRTGILHVDVVTANLVAAWLPADLESNDTNARFAGWLDTIDAKPLFVGLDNGSVPWIIPSDGTKPFAVRNRWDVDFVDTGDIRPQNLNSTRVLSTGLDISRRLYNAIHTDPTVADGSNWRRYQNDLTVMLVGWKTVGTNSLVLFECYGLELRFDRLTQTVEATIGADSAGVGNPNDLVTFSIGTATGLGEAKPFTIVFRYNAVDNKATLFINQKRFLGTTVTGTNTYQDRTGLTFARLTDYAAAVAVPACLSDAQIAVMLAGYLGELYSFERTAFRYFPQSTPVGLSQLAAAYEIDDVDDTPGPALSATKPTGTLTLDGLPNDGDRYVISDGVNAAVTFEFDSDASVTQSTVLRRVIIQAGDLTQTLTNLATAINAAPVLDIAAAYPGSGDTVLLSAEELQLDGEPSTNVPITAPVNVSGNLAFTGMSGGTGIQSNWIDQVALDLPSLLDSFARPAFQYTDSPYSVLEWESVFGDDDVASTIFGDPLPTIVNVTATASHSVTAIANAGPTDAGQVRTWWEIELIDGSTEVMVQVDLNPSNNFATNRNHTDTFPIPLGQDWEDLRIRFVIQAVADASQVWRSLFFRMEGANFDNSQAQVIIVPGPETPSPPGLSDLQVSIEDSQFVLRQEQEAARFSVRVAEDSRYKFSRAFIDSARSDGPEFDLLGVLSDFYRSGSSFQVHRVTTQDIGFLDRVAVRFYGPGSERLWWVIAYANAIVDPDAMRPGDALVIPPREAVRAFIARRPVR